MLTVLLFFFRKLIIWEQIIRDALSILPISSLHNFSNEGARWKERRYNARYILPFHLVRRVFRCILMTGARETDDLEYRG